MYFLIADAGLALCQYRRPDAPRNGLRELNAVSHPDYRHHSALHQHHEIAKEYKMERLHFTEAKRNEICEEALKALKTDNNRLSTSIHNINTYNTLSSAFDYTFFGPVFNSISKQGYTSSVKHDFVFPVKKSYPKVIAIGGIEATNIQKLFNMQFDGVAVLGMIWQNLEESIQQFKAVQKAWKRTDQ
ncbi:MAG: thiamine phosphate synthase [Flavisolibacter sp.]